MEFLNERDRERYNQNSNFFFFCKFYNMILKFLESNTVTMIVINNWGKMKILEFPNTLISKHTKSIAKVTLKERHPKVEQNSQLLLDKTTKEILWKEKYNFFNCETMTLIS